MKNSRKEGFQKKKYCKENNLKRKKIPKRKKFPKGKNSKSEKL